MKRWIHAASDYVPDSAKQLSKIKKAISEYTPEQVEYAKECQQELTDEISAYYAADDNTDLSDYDLAGALHSIKSDYLIGAAETDLMAPEEFLRLLDLVDEAGTEKAIAMS